MKKIIFVMCLILAAFLMVTTRAAFSFDFNVTVNGKPVTIGNDADGQKENTPDAKQQNVKQGGLPSQSGQQPERVGVARVFGKGVIGPDVIGMRIGNSPADVRVAIKSRGLKIYEEIALPLLGGGDSKFVFHSKDGAFIRYLRNIRGVDAAGNNHINVAFTPNPGHERIMGIAREAKNQKDNLPTLEAFERSITEKYGTPTYTELYKATRTNIYYWIYDNGGTLRKPGASQLKDYINSHCDNVGPIDVNKTVVDPKYTDSMKQIQEFSDRMVPAICGGISLRIYAIISSSNTNLVESTITYLEGYDEYIGSAMAMRANIDEYLKNANEQAVKKGQKVKSDL